MTDQAHPRWTPGMPLPKYADRKTLAAIISHEFFPVSPRTLREWPLLAHRPNKRVVYTVEEALRVAGEKMRKAPVYRQAGQVADPLGGGK